MAKHTTMPPRTQPTPHGDVTLTSRWMRDRYYLVASGSYLALRWLFPGKPDNTFESHGTATRYAFAPASEPITIERHLRRVCSCWQDLWNERLTEAHQPKLHEAQVVPSTLDTLIAKYREAHDTELSPATVERNRHLLNRWSERIGIACPIGQITEDRLLAARARLIAELRPSTVNTGWLVLKRILQWGTEKGWLPSAPHRLIGLVRDTGPKREKSWWTAAEVDMALAAAEYVDVELERHRKPDEPEKGTALLLTGVGCLLGLRYEEIIMLRWQDLDLDAVDPHHKTPAPVARIVAHDDWAPKNGESRAIPIHERLHRILLHLRRRDGYVLHAAKEMPKRGGTKRVYRYDPKKLWLMVLDRAMASGAKHITPHGMRHSFASNLLMAGVSDVLVARWLGHANTGLVHETYGHLLAYHGAINQMKSGR